MIGKSISMVEIVVDKIVLDIVMIKVLESQEERPFQWYPKSAEAGYHLGQNNLGSCYNHGIGNTKHEEAKLDKTDSDDSTHKGTLYCDDTNALAAYFTIAL
ncbi:hypothetical protein Glove_9g261 [Diversispora epigaea]|uniref:Uncharacterized protein n=1 Tax=Diversispora epigaea TaxID=1348612 RepID=A0A397JYB7_9GLOM|nr:hypothetical protein Glove_9g261 [Diversispora epigaea]